MTQFGFGKAAWQKAIKRGELTTRDWIIPLDNLLVTGGSTSRKHVKYRLLHVGLLNDCCRECGLKEWHGQKIPLELHHINGIPDDNRLDNLALLCPNCHSLTPNYCGKNKKRA